MLPRRVFDTSRSGTLRGGSGGPKCGSQHLKKFPRGELCLVPRKAWNCRRYGKDFRLLRGIVQPCRADIFRRVSLALCKCYLLLLDELLQALKYFPQRREDGSAVPTAVDRPLGFA